MWRIAKKIALFSTVMAVAWVVRGDDLPDDLLAGEKALAAGRFAAAERHFRQLVASRPGLIDGYRGLSRALVGAGRRDEAAAVLIDLGEGLLGVGQYAPAAEILGKAASFRETPHLLALLGKAHLFAQDPRAAIPPFERALELGDKTAATRVYLAAAYWDSGRPDEAEAFYRGILAADPSLQVASHQLGRLLLWQGRYDEAAVHLERAMVLPGPDVVYDLAQAHAAAGRAAAALDAYRRTIELAPGHFKAHYGLALLLEKKGEHDEARKALATYQRLYAAEREAARRAGLERARLDRGWELLQNGEHEAAVRHFSSLEESAETLAGAAAGLARLGDLESAVEHLERAVILAPDRPDLRYELAEKRLALSEAALRER